MMRNVHCNMNLMGSCLSKTGDRPGRGVCAKGVIFAGLLFLWEEEGLPDQCTKLLTHTHTKTLPLHQLVYAWSGFNSV